MEVAAEVGSDVAFALHGGTALGTGRGERLVPVLSRHTFHWVVALADHGLSTPTVFAELDRLRDRPEAPRRVGDVEPVLEALASGEARSLALLLGNDLQAAAVSLDPGLRRTLRAGVDAGALAGVVSGSGPTCVFLCAGQDAAVRVAAELAGAGVCRTVRVAHGPVPGARVIDGGGPRARRPRPGQLRPRPRRLRLTCPAPPRCRSERAVRCFYAHELPVRAPGDWKPCPTSSTSSRCRSASGVRSPSSTACPSASTPATASASSAATAAGSRRWSRSSPGR